PSAVRMTKQTPRQLARSRGRRTYVGAPCPKHGPTRRHVSNGTCVQCGRVAHASTEAQRRKWRAAQKERRRIWRLRHPSKWKAARAAAKKARDKARLAGKLYFHGMPDRLGHTKRLVSSTACVICGNRSFKRMSPKRKAQVLKTN